MQLIVSCRKLLDLFYLFIINYRCHYYYFYYFCYYNYTIVIIYYYDRIIYAYYYYYCFCYYYHNNSLLLLDQMYDGPTKAKDSWVYLDVKRMCYHMGFLYLFSLIVSFLLYFILHIFDVYYFV